VSTAYFNLFLERPARRALRFASRSKTVPAVAGVRHHLSLDFTRNLASRINL
jgi:hypothetical protein